MIIAIDGPSASGKSTTAIGVAKRLGITYLDTGAMYRAVTFGLIENNIKFDHSSDLENYLKKIKLEFFKTKTKTLLHLNGRNITEEIRSSKVTESVSEVSALKIVRSSMVLIQRKMADSNDCILEGRDICTVVFPNADFKFFLIADEEVRAKRRLNDLRQLGELQSIDKVIHDIIERDYKDSNRVHSPLKKAEDAIIIDTSNLNINEVINKIMNVVNK
jgi:cytidylate kinase